MPRRTTENLGMLVDEQLLAEQPRLPGHPIWGAPSQSIRWDERWLYWWVWGKLDSYAVCVPVYLVFTSLACLSPDIIYDRLTIQQPDAAELVISLHAAGTAFLWLAFVFMFHNLRVVVRGRVGFLRQVARQMGVNEKEILACTNREGVIRLIVRQYEQEWPKTKAVLQAKEEMTHKEQVVKFVQTRYRLNRKKQAAKLRKFEKLMNGTATSRGLQHWKTLKMKSVDREDQDIKPLSPSEATSVERSSEVQQFSDDQKKTVIQDCNLFQQALRGKDGAQSAEVYTKLATLAVVRRYRKKQVICLQGSPAGDLFVVVSGTISAHVHLGGTNIKWTHDYTKR
eukprot:COSAG01_NODE_5342_length_4324_cov_2.688521_2_plen_339_part_00